MIWGFPEEREGRRPFSMTTKKIEWMLAAGRDPKEYTEKKKFYKTSKCRRCKRKMTWGDRSYDFDHKDNNPTHNGQRNCYLVCVICHRKATKLEKRIYENTWTGHRIYETVKKRVGYKKRRGVKTVRAKAKSTKAKSLRAKTKHTARIKSTKSRATKTRRRRRT